jgi:hypothetical protein
MLSVPASEARLVLEPAPLLCDSVAARSPRSSEKDAPLWEGSASAWRSERRRPLARLLPGRLAARLEASEPAGLISAAAASDSAVSLRLLSRSSASERWETGLEEK